MSKQEEGQRFGKAEVAIVCLTGIAMSMVLKGIDSGLLAAVITAIAAVAGARAMR